MSPIIAMYDESTFKYIEDGRTPDRSENYTYYKPGEAPPEVQALMRPDIDTTPSDGNSVVAQEMTPSELWRGVPYRTDQTFVGPYSNEYYNGSAGASGQPASSPGGGSGSGGQTPQAPTSSFDALAVGTPPPANRAYGPPTQSGQYPTLPDAVRSEGSFGPQGAMTPNPSAQLPYSPLTPAGQQFQFATLPSDPNRASMTPANASVMPSTPNLPGASTVPSAYSFMDETWLHPQPIQNMPQDMMAFNDQNHWRTMLNNAVPATQQLPPQIMTGSLQGSVNNPYNLSQVSSQQTMTPPVMASQPVQNTVTISGGPGQSPTIQNSNGTYYDPILGIWREASPVSGTVLSR